MRIGTPAALEDKRWGGGSCLRNKGRTVAKGVRAAFSWKAGGTTAPADLLKHPVKSSAQITAADSDSNNNNNDNNKNNNNFGAVTS